MLHRYPEIQGLYDPAFEHDACGVAMVANMHGTRSHTIVRQAVQALCNLDHRGASGAEINTGDGAGILLQIPDALFRAEVGFELPPMGEYATGIAFLDVDSPASQQAAFEALAESHGIALLGWREVPTLTTTVGPTAMSVAPAFRQVFLAKAGSLGIDLDRAVYVLRKQAERELDIYFPSLSARTIVYKGMLTTHQLDEVFLDLQDVRCESALAIVHSRFSTNTFPSWPLAHPYRYVAHNGEINTVRGNRNWMRAREAMLESDLIPGDLSLAFPIAAPKGSDSASFDEVLELLHLGGRSLPHAVLMMIPEAWENHESMDPARRAFYRYHSSLMEPWDGPASIVFTDGTVIGAVLDRNGLRPSRFWVMDDGVVVLASEVGVIDIAPERVTKKGRLEPGRMFLVDTTAGRIIEDEEIKSELAAAAPYQAWMDEHLIQLSDLPPRRELTPQRTSILRQQRAFGYTEEELRLLVAPMARAGAEAIGSMGTDTPIAVLSKRPRLLFDYFQQLFAQVTNPPLDAIREELVTSLGRTIGPERNVLDSTPEQCHQIAVATPILSNEELAKLRYIDEDGAGKGHRSVTLDALFEIDGGGAALEKALQSICTAASDAMEAGATIIILSDRFADERLAPIPSVLVTGAVHHHLIRQKSRTRVGLVVETGEAREVHHFAMLIGFGAAAVNPYLAFDSLNDMIRQQKLPSSLSARQANKRYVKAVGKGLLKVMSKMGISTIASYTGAQVFEAIGIGRTLIDPYFTGTTSRLGGIGLDEVAEEVRLRHQLAYPSRPEERAHRGLTVGGEYQWRREGEYHLFNPETVYKLQHATRQKRFDLFREYSQQIDDQSRDLATLRGLFRFASERAPIAIDEVEPVTEIVKRFSTGAMSYGSISKEAHENLAIAMNRLGGKSNTGEGGEDADRFLPDANGDLRRSAIKQVASGRFGVTSEYLTNADDIQIKMAQGAKPGEGGQLPGHKVYPWVARTRHSTPGVGLISPPPHHDIYSIEDLAQLIHDLKNANPTARVHVKLVSEVGVGTVAAGVSKAHADVVLISGHDGGTGASPLTSIKHAGTPWELGLAETQQTLLLNGLRDRIVVQVDGQLKTGRDVVVAALLGAEEFGFATAPLVVSGCVMMRVCHLDTCPVGIATQNPELRKKFAGKPEFVVNFFEFIAEEVRTLLAELGFRSIEEAVGHVEALDVDDAVAHWKTAGLDLRAILHQPENRYSQSLHRTVEQDHGLDRALDQELIRLAKPALDEREPVRIELPIRNVNRTVGTMLGHEVTKRFGGDGLPDDTISISFSGSAGQSFGAFVPRGMTLELRGDANDYFGKGLSGGRLLVMPPEDSHLVAEENIVAGNVCLYGATAGEAFIRGRVGERFAVRNSGATAVVEGVGDHGCEYMTGGKVVVLGPTGRNFGAGMSGGEAFVWDTDESFANHVNFEMVDLDSLDEDDRLWLRSAIARHLELTGSAVAERLLADWSASVEQFWKVMPEDYKRVLRAAAEAEAKGIPVDEAIMAAAHN
jgi:glutamate synthase (NADPH/NADH) large chain